VNGSATGLDEELEALRDLVRRFVVERIRPAEDALDPTARGLPADVLAALQVHARRVGLWCLDAPAEFGGGGLDAFPAVVVWEEASRHRFCHPTPGGGVFGLNPPSPLYQGTPEQIDRYVRPHIAEGWVAFNAVAEASGGTDPAGAIRTTARREGSDWVLNGTKMWITHADRARYGVVYARSERGVSCFIVDADLPGVSVELIPVIRDHWPTVLHLDEVRVPAANLVGEEGQGLQLAGRWLQRGRLVYAARSIGVAEEAVRYAVEWVNQRETFGRLLATRQATQFAIADSRVEIEAARGLTWTAARHVDAGGDARRDVAIAKLYATEMAFRVVDRMMQLLGATGMSRELPLEGWLRDLRVARVVEGASEILRVHIARAELGPSRA
jgi:acyl-CoA dehydrogenase